MPTTNPNDRRWMILFLVAALCLVATRWHFVRQSAGVEPVAQRKPAPDMILPQLGGGQWKLADHRGQVVLVNYWATWCEPCRDELPGLLRVAHDSAPKGLAVVGVSFDSGHEPARTQAVQSFVTQFRVPYPIAFPDRTLNFESGDIGLPTSILIDRQGRAAKTYVGEVDRATLAKDVAALLAES
jgi:thiol-disulfide isomerase/thioredoxin